MTGDVFRTSAWFWVICSYCANCANNPPFYLTRLTLSVWFAAIPVGIVVVRGDCDLETCRLYIDRLQEASLRLLLLLLLLSLLFCFYLTIIISWHPQRNPSTGIFRCASRRPETLRVSCGKCSVTHLWKFLMQMLRLSVNLQTCLCLLGLTPGAIYWPQSALSGI